MTTNATHDPELKSWVESANASGADFPIQNLPHGVFRRRGPPVFPHLAPVAASGLDLQLEVLIETPKSAGQAMRLTRSSSRHAYWSLAQMLAHHTENGCNMRPGDLIGTGTQSGPGDGEKGCLMA